MNHHTENNLNHFNDEIDLVDLLKKLWLGRYIIITIVLLSLTIAFFILKFLPSYYKIEATIDCATEEHYQSIKPSQLPAIGSKISEYQVAESNYKKNYENLLLRITSLQSVKNFWNQRTKQPFDFNQTDSLEYKNFKNFFNDLTIDNGNSKLPDYTPRKISFLHLNANEGVLILNEYLDYINGNAWNGVSSKLIQAYSANLAALNLRYENVKTAEEKKLHDELIRLKEQLKIAQLLGITDTPYRDLENIQLDVLNSRDYLLGVKALRQQIEILESRQTMSLAPFSMEMRNLENQKNIISTDIERLSNRKENIKIFTIVNKPDSSLNPVTPNKPLILVAVLFLSLFISMVFVLIRSAFLYFK